VRIESQAIAHVEHLCANLHPHSLVHRECLSQASILFEIVIALKLFRDPYSPGSEEVSALIARSLGMAYAARIHDGRLCAAHTDGGLSSEYLAARQTAFLSNCPIYLMRVWALRSYGLSMRLITILI
jgi:hypothetical protein